MRRTATSAWPCSAIAPAQASPPPAKDGATRYRHAVNTGSVGKPKDGDPRACYALLHGLETAVHDDPESLRVESVEARVVIDEARDVLKTLEISTPQTILDVA